jgi:hypothetical protein
MQEQLPSSIKHFQHTLNSYKTHHNGIFKNALSLSLFLNRTRMTD